MVWQAVSFDDAAKKRIEKAIAFEKRLRLEGLLEIPQKVGCFELRHITPRDILELEFAENRIATGESPELDDYVHLVWTLTKQKRFFKVRQIRKIARALEGSQLLRNEVLSFYYSAFNDMPATGSNKKEDNNNQSSVYLCTLIDSLASSYGWSLEQILKTPMSCCLQLLQRTMKRNLGDKYSLRNGITQQAKANELKRIRYNG
tara:strand:+ start:2269 stop:2877 length:609 start_codon:yes stop_codon:yes gene_type:complete